MKTLIHKFKEGVQAGMTGRDQTVTVVVDCTETEWDGLALRSVAIMAQARQRAGKLSFLNNQTLKVSDLLTRTSTDGVAVLKAQLSTMAPADKVVYLFTCGIIDDDTAAAQLDVLKSTGKITNEQFDRALAELGA